MKLLLICSRSKEEVESDVDSSSLMLPLFGSTISEVSLQFSRSTEFRIKVSWGESWNWLFKVGIVYWIPTSGMHLNIDFETTRQNQSFRRRTVDVGRLRRRTAPPSDRSAVGPFRRNSYEFNKNQSSYKTVRFNWFNLERQYVHLTSMTNYLLRVMSVGNRILAGAFGFCP